MSKKKGTSKYFNLGENEFQKKLSIYYSWVAPIVLFLFACGMFYDRAIITGIIILLLSVFHLPILKKYTSKIPKLMRVFITLALIILAFLSMNLYV